MIFHEKDESKANNQALTREGIERLSDQIEEYLRKVGTERLDVIRIRFALEEALLRWRDHFGESAVVSISTMRSIGSPTITLGLTGEPYDPLTNSENDLGVWADSLLSGVGLNPIYSYSRNTNTIQLKLRRRHMHPALALIIAVASGLAVGYLGNILLPADIKTAVLQMIFDPIRDVFFRILNAAAGPIVFFSVLTAIFGVGNTASMNKNGRRLIVHYLAGVMVFTVITAAATALLMRLPFSEDSTIINEIHELLDFIFHIVPSDIFSPIISGDSPQLILIAIILGYGFLAVGRKTEELVSIVGQINDVGLLIADWLGHITPFLLSVLLILGMWNNSMAASFSILKPAGLFFLICLSLMLIQLIYVSIREKISPFILISKMRDSFMTALRTCSVNSAYSSNEVCCESRLGMDHKFTGTALPLGLLIYMPAGTISIMVVIIYEAAVHGVTASPFWFLTAVLLTVMLEAASPPVAGVDLLAYAVIFSQQGIPTEALTNALVLDIIFGLITSPLNQFMLQLNLIPAADRANMLDKKVLHKL